MWPDRVSNPGPVTYESGALPIALRGPAIIKETKPMSFVHGYGFRTEGKMWFQL